MSNSAARSFGSVAIPGDATLRTQLAEVVGCMESAPAIQGTRPWRLAVAEDTIEVHVTPDQRVRKVDPDSRESTIATGSAVSLLRRALRCHLLQPEVRYIRDFKQPSLLARLHIVGRAFVSP